MPLLRKIVFYVFLRAYLLGCPPSSCTSWAMGFSPAAPQGW